MVAALMHVVHVVHSLAVGGTENGVVNVVTAMGSEVRHTVIALTQAGPLAARLPTSATVYALGKRPGWDLPAVARLTRLLRRLRPDVVHSRNWASLDAVVAARLAGAPIVVHGEHGREITDPEGRNPRRNRVRRLLAPLVTRFVAVSEDLHRWLVDRVGIAAGRVVTIRNGVDAARFAPEARPAARGALGVSPDTVVLGTVGRLDPVKDHVGLVDAFARVAGECPAAILVLVGDGPCRSAVEARIAGHGVGDRVRLLGQRLDVPALLAGFDAFALPSRAEGMSNTILEAMAAGVPVVATRVGGSPEMVEDGVTGSLVPPGDPGRLAAALGRYAGDPHLRAIHGKAGRERVLAEFDLPRMAERYLHLYRELTSARRREVGA